MATFRIDAAVLVELDQGLCPVVLVANGPCTLNDGTILLP